VLKKENRLSQRSDILKVKEDGELINASLLSLLIYRNKDKKIKRFGVVVSKKISKRAVDRNKVKRLIMESLKNNLNKIEGGLEILFLVKKNILGKKYKEVEEEVKKIFKIDSK